MRHVLIALLKAYRLVISPLYGNVCRYHPSCSSYALRAVETQGAARGGWLAVRRVARCHPWARGGYDPVPDTPEGWAYATELTARGETAQAARYRTGRRMSGPAAVDGDSSATARTRPPSVAVAEVGVTGWTTESRGN